MTVERYYMIVIASQSDWLKNVAQVCQPMRSTTVVLVIFAML